VNNFLEGKIAIGEKLATPFLPKNGIFRDGTTPLYRDVDGKYVMCSTAFDPASEEPPYFVAATMEVRVRDDMLHGSEPVRVYRDGEVFGNHYVKFASDDAVSQPNVISGDTFSILSHHNGTDVDRYLVRFVD
jgi:hypothetical protein